MKRFLLLLALLMATLGCQPPTETNAPAAKAGTKLRIAVIPKGTTHEFWKSVHYGASQAAKELDVEIDWLGPPLENDRQGQITIVQNFITNKVDGIVLAPLDSHALVDAVKQANSANIPVVIFDSALDDESVTVSYVATDNTRGGELAAEEMAKRLNGKGNVIMMRYNKGSESTQQREEGFLKKLKEYPEIKILESEQYAGTTQRSALDKAQQLLNIYGNDVNGFFAVCEPNAAGTLKALEDLKLSEKVVFIGFDPNPTMVQAMADGKMQGIVLQDPVKMGYLGVKTMVQHLRGEKIDKRISTGEHIATPDNMNNPEMKTLLAPPQFD
ncbi:MAG TPA: substrate-binding domain-containing protein [Pirellulaceae bacterium]|nr:substrate-binding domain-containing protein [Pirellulaceae bacterium]